MCGDSTDWQQVRRALGVKRDGPEELLADLVHADPPYGMGKEADGVLNDNLRAERLDNFQHVWIGSAMMCAKDNAGLYIWGNAPDLWRLWWRVLEPLPIDLTVRNEIVWAKGSGFGMSSAGAHSYPPETERCLFIMRGQQFLGNQNKDEYWEGYEPLRLWMVEQRDKAEWGNAAVNEITRTHMAGHWFGRSQFAVINRENYDKLRQAAFVQGDVTGSQQDWRARMGFALDYDQVLERFGSVKDGGNANRRELSAEMREGRTFFDNTHDIMTDVWRFGRVVGDERFGHATPKPVAMIARAVLSSCPPDGLVLEPFLGTGTTLMAAELTGRRCAGLELEPAYVDIVVRRWQEKTGKAATLEANSATFEAIAHRRSDPAEFGYLDTAPHLNDDLQDLLT